MERKRRTTGVAIVATACLVLGGAIAAGPAQAKRKKGKKKAPACAVYSPAEPQSDSEQTAEAAKAELIKVTDKATEKAPITVEYEHGPALWETATQTPIIEDTKWFNVQVDTKKPQVGLYIRLDWAPGPSDIDLYLWGEDGSAMTQSGAANAAPVPPFLDAGGNGGMGFESIPGFASSRCDGYTIESRAFSTPGEAMTMTVWLGPVGDNIQ